MSRGPFSSYRRIQSRAAASQAAVGGRIAVFAPSPLLTVTIEVGTDHPEVHLHAGGRGLGRAARRDAGSGGGCCCALGGEPGRMLKGLIEVEPLDARGPRPAATPNGVYIHDRRSGARIEIVSVDSRPLGPARNGRVVRDRARRRARRQGDDGDRLPAAGRRRSRRSIDGWISDLRANEKVVIADFTGPPLRGTLKAGVELLRLNEEELVWERATLPAMTPAEIVAERAPAARRRGAPGVDLSGLGAGGADRRCHRTQAGWNSSLRCSRRWTTAAPATPCLPRPGWGWHAD